MTLKEAVAKRDAHAAEAERYLGIEAHGSAKGIVGAWATAHATLAIYYDRLTAGRAIAEG